MKKLYLFIFVFLFSMVSFAQKARTIAGNIDANTTLFSDTIYTLEGYVYVKNNATLTIQPGTIIKGKSGTKATLIIPSELAFGKRKIAMVQPYTTLIYDIEVVEVKTF